MKKVRSAAISMVVMMAFVATGGAMLRSQAQTQSSGTSADNTKLNEQDRDTSSPTADQQKENRSDRDITKQIRQSIVSDQSLSAYAHNVKVITQNGQVTLKGPVRSDEEKRTIEAKATEVAGEHKVTSELNVKPKQ
ncbi:MAG TPA: BON domain-containing protein [Terriglobales bacterium]|nr:BON domain-containing protein [Terriglobales bacterium]